MSILFELKNIFILAKIPVEVGAFSGVPADTFCVLTPLVDTYENFADNLPRTDICEVRLSLFTKQNYLALQKQITNNLWLADFTITSRQFIGLESDTGYYHIAIDVAKHYELEEI